MHHPWVLRGYPGERASLPTVMSSSLPGSHLIFFPFSLVFPTITSLIKYLSPNPSPRVCFRGTQTKAIIDPRFADEDIAEIVAEESLCFQFTFLLTSLGLPRLNHNHLWLPGS